MYILSIYGTRIRYWHFIFLFNNRENDNNCLEINNYYKINIIEDYNFMDIQKYILIRDKI